MEIRRNSDRNKNAQFFETRCILALNSRRPFPEIENENKSFNKRAVVTESSARPLRDIIERVKKRDVDFMVEGNNQVSFSLGADLGDKKELGLLRFDMMYDLKYLLAFPILDSKPLTFYETLTS